MERRNRFPFRFRRKGPPACSPFCTRLPAHVPVFEAPCATRTTEGSGTTALRRRGVAGEGPEAVTHAVRVALEEAVAEGARAALCTCSTIGAVAVVAAGARVVVAATLESTLGPTAAPTEEEGRRIGRAVEVRTLLVEDAWAHVEAGDTEG
ncbi:hypothetical protein ACRAWF_02175 [Streptomyces sp. L7]